MGQSLRHLNPFPPALSGRPGDGAGVHVDAAQAFVEGALSRAFQRAGLGAWVAPAGCADPPVPLKIQRVLVDGGSSSGGGDAALPEGVAGRVRLFPASAGAYWVRLLPASHVLLTLPIPRLRRAPRCPPQASMRTFCGP